MKPNTKVKLSKNSFSENDKYNPMECEGVVIEIRETKVNPIIVLWENGIRNSYQRKVLIVIE